MLHRTPRVALVLITFTSMVIATSYGCGGSGDVPSEADGSDLTEGGPISLQDSAPVPTDGARDSQVGTDSSVDTGVDTGVDADADAAVVPPPGPLWPGYVDYDINHILSTGQSNATANSANPVLTTTQPYTNIMFNAGPHVGANPTSFIPLIEGDNNVETMASGMANRVTQFALDTFEFGVRPGYPTKHDVLVSNHARSGWTYWCLRKGGCTYKAPPVPFADAMGQVARAKILASAAAKTYVVRAVTTIHGESEHTSYCGCTTPPQNPEFPIDGTDGTFRTIRDYADGLIEWQRDYETEVKAITGQAEPVPLFVSQISGWNNSRYSRVPNFQLDAHKRSAGKVILIGASYPFQFRTDCLHFTADSQRRLGEYFAKVYAKVVFQGEAWEPVRPRQITRAGNVITVRYHVPAPPLVLDTVRVTNPGQFGFEYVDSNGEIAITNVVVSAPDTVTLTLASTPTGTGKKLRYAQNQIPRSCVGPGTLNAGGARGNVRDSDGTVSRHGYDLHNWGIIFDENVP